MEVDACLPIITKDALTYKKSFNIYSRMANTSWLDNASPCEEFFQQSYKNALPY